QHLRLDLTQAPLLRFVVAKDPGADHWLVLAVHHHLIGDHSTLEILHEEIEAILEGHEDDLPAAEPFRNVVAQARLGVSEAEHERYFRERLGDIDEPMLPFGLAEVRGDGKEVVEAYRLLPQALNDRLRGQARRLGVSLASLCHVAWGQVVARTSGRETAVFGTVLLGRMQAGAGADRAMG
uniref:condensation domain-containing protein n=1 Tax=Mesorhizobium sp. dw_380 TaxID=2812001 RepID=UPI001BDF0AE8